MKLHWYICTQPEKPTCDKIVGNHYGFEVEPSYEVIEKHDLRKVGHETFEELCNRYF